MDELKNLTNLAQTIFVETGKDHAFFVYSHADNPDILFNEQVIVTFRREHRLEPLRTTMFMADAVEGAAV